MAYFYPKVVSIKCNKCGKLFVYNHREFFHDENESNKLAIKRGWIVCDGVHICPKCASFIAKNGFDLLFYQFYKETI